MTNDSGVEGPVMVLYIFETWLSVCDDNYKQIYAEDFI